ncbi:MAG: RagB/SusD family nutrient uptake outer membrane protein [Niabella sp.]
MKRIYFGACVLLLLTVSCKKSYFDSKGDLSGTTLANYYNTEDEVRSLTSTLYSGLPWSGFEQRAMCAIGDVMAGNEYAGGSDDPPFIDFSLSSTSGRVSAAWKAFYKVAGWATSYKNALELKKATGVSASFIDPAIAECDFMIATAYFYLGRIWGAVPIVTDPAATSLDGTSGTLPRYYQSDVLQFATNLFKNAVSSLPETDEEAGRVTSYAAKAMLAKLYLYRATALSETQYYDSAKVMALEVINSGNYSLVSDYQSMFNSSSYNNNSESIFAIQHNISGTNYYGSCNLISADFGNSDLATSDISYWQLYVPSIDFRDSAFESGDGRREGTMMEQGWEYAAWKPQKSGATAYNAFYANGFVYDTTQQNTDGALSATRVNIAKYVVGPGPNYGGETVGTNNQTGINFMMLRYSDVLLIYAEAVLGTASSTSDAAALSAFNAVRTRAGLASKTTITFDDIFKERRAEFAFEGDYWFDIQRQGYTKAKAIIMAQNRGTAAYANYVTTFTSDMLYLPIPADEITSDPNLANDPVAYY